MFKLIFNRLAKINEKDGRTKKKPTKIRFAGHL